MGKSPDINKWGWVFNTFSVTPLYLWQYNKTNLTAPIAHPEK
jgi:hypothetical protein